MKKNYTLLAVTLLLSCSIKAQVSKACFKPVIVPNYTWTATSGGPFSGTNYGQVAAADFNNDGITDIAAAANGIYYMEVKLGNNTGTFTPSQDISTNVIDIVAADVNNDNNKDLVTLFWDGASQYNIVTYLGLGNGTFGAAITTTSAMSDVIYVVDVNNDGSLDVVQNLVIPGSLVFRLGNGTGNFAAPSNTITGITKACFDDFNNDGFIDFVSTNASGINVKKYNGNGTGAFTLAGTYPATSVGFGNTGIVKSADLNADGFKDIVVICGGGAVNYCTSLLGTSTGSFSAYTNVASGKIGSVNIGEFNGDTYPDLICNYYGSGPNLTLYFNDGPTTTFTLTQVLATSPTIYRDYTTLADFNQDGKLDLLAVKTGTANFKEKLNIYLQTAIPSLTVTSSNNIICTGQSAVLTATSSGSYHNVFFSGGGSATGILTQTVSPTTTTSYTFGAWGGPSSTDDICPFITDVVFTQSVSACTGINEMTDNNLISIYPNPANDFIIVDFSTTLEVTDNKIVYIINALGEIVVTEKIISNHTTLKTENLASGIYFVKLEGKNSSAIKKFIKQ